MRPFKILSCTIALVTILISGCTPPPLPPVPPSPLTQGNVQLTLEKGKTTQNQVLQAFGSPNVSSINSDGQEVWTYQQMAVSSTAQASADIFTIIFLNDSLAARSGQRIQRAMTLIITFDHAYCIIRKSNF